MARLTENDGFDWINPWRVAGWSLACCLLLTPLAAMQFTTEVAWTPSDFVFAALLIGAVGAGVELAVRLSRDWTYRTGFAIALAGGFMLTWINAAVGIIREPNAWANLLYLGLLAAGGLAALIGRFTPRAMAGVLTAMALAQVGITVFVIGAGFGFTAPIDLCFAALWLLSAWLFRQAARRAPALTA